MAPSSASCSRALLALLLFLAIFDSQRLAVVAQLQYNYYAKTCPKAYEIIESETYRYYKIHGNYATSAYRNLFHDCAVNKCDGSILVAGSSGELASFKNFGMRNFKYFYELKKTLEAACPGVVSCADLVALTGVYSVHILGDINVYNPDGSVYIKTGRKDTGVSRKADADAQLPSKDDSTATVLNRFKQLGLSTEYAVALLGGHSVGRVHCENLLSRAYPPSPEIFLPGFVSFIQKRCPNRAYPKPTDPFYVRFDEITPMGIDNGYYKNLINGRGLLHVDSQLYSDPITKPYVVKFAADNEYFKLKFAEAIRILVEYNAYSDPNGKVLKDCKKGI